MSDRVHRTAAELEAGLPHIRLAPEIEGRLELLVRRTGLGEREILAEGVLDPAAGLVGDHWRVRPSRRTKDGSPHPEMQINIMSSRVIALLAGAAPRWALAGDQLYVDLDLGVAALSPGARLAIGDALLLITDPPHLGCAKFAARFGTAAARFVNSEIGRRLRLRGVNAKVLSRGVVRPGDLVRKLG